MSQFFLNVLILIVLQSGSFRPAIVIKDRSIRSLLFVGHKKVIPCKYTAYLFKLMRTWHEYEGPEPPNTFSIFTAWIFIVPLTPSKTRRSQRIHLYNSDLTQRESRRESPSHRNLFKCYGQNLHFHHNILRLGRRITNEH